MRYKEFNTNKVLENCIPLFWTNGFGSCSINDIVKKTNVNRFSLYHEFQNKEGLLENALELYKDRYSKHQINLLQENDSIQNVLTSFFMSYMEDSDHHPPGCFIIHIATELADNNTMVKNVLDDYIGFIESQLKTTLNSHKETEENSVFLAKHLTGLFCTLTCFCVIHSFEERRSLVENGINILLKKNKIHGTYTQ